MRATWIIATNYRPTILRATLRCALNQVPVPGWEVTATVAGASDDPGALVAAQEGALYVPTKEQFPGHRWQAAFEASDCDVVMLTGDDDLQPGCRLSGMVRAWEQGHRWTTDQVVRYVHLSSGESSIWVGEDLYIGSSMTIGADLLRSAGGFPTHIRQGLDGAISKRLADAGADRHVRGGEWPVLCLQHAGNLWPRLCPPKGMVWDARYYKILGDGHWRDVPMDSAQRHCLGSLFDDPAGVSGDIDRQLQSLTPHLAAGAIMEIDAHLSATQSSKVLEWGSGDSTVWFSRRADVVSIEHDMLWASWARDRLVHTGSGFRSVELALCPADLVDQGDHWLGYQADDQRTTFRSYVNVVLPHRQFDVVLVDGRCRARCIERVIAEDLVAPGGLLVLDDSQRPRYALSLEAVASRGWARTEHPGLSWMTTSFRRPPIP